MAERKEVTRRIMLNTGVTLDVRLLDGITIDDVLLQGVKAEGYRVVTGRDVYPEVTRKMKDYLIKLGVITD